MYPFTMNANTSFYPDTNNNSDANRITICQSCHQNATGIDLNLSKIFQSIISDSSLFQLSNLFNSQRKERTIVARRKLCHCKMLGLQPLSLFHMLPCPW